MKELESIIHLLSGGMDSTVLLYDLHADGHPLHCVLFDYGQKHAAKELPFARLHCDRLGIAYTELKLPTLYGSKLTGRGESNVVPNRNAILLSVAVSLAIDAKASMVTYASNADDAGEFPDCSMGFVSAFNMMLETTKTNVRVCAPYADKPKFYIYGLAQEFSVPLELTWSCYAGGDAPCGECGACVKRKALGLK